MQDMSYEALTNLEDVKLTAPPELLATMPLDMCLKGGQWEDKVSAVTLWHRKKQMCVAVQYSEQNACGDNLCSAVCCNQNMPTAV